MSPGLDWSHTRADAIPSFRVGDVVETVDHPAGCDRWEVVATDGVIVTLRSLDGCRPSMVRRFARAVRKVSDK